MMLIKFRSKAEHEDILKKVKKMKKFTDELEDMLEDCYDEDDYDFRSDRHHKDWEDEEDAPRSRYGYRRGMK